MTSQSHSNQHEIGIEILTYLLHNPDSQDTLEGITQWWLLETYIRKQTDLVRQALSELVHQGFIIEICGPNAQVSYQINKNKLQEIKQTVQGKR